MLTTQERLRIEDELVRPYTVTWRGHETSYEPKLVWVGADSDTIGDSEFTEYPAIIAEFSSRGDVVEVEDSLYNVVQRVFDEESGDIYETRESPQVDELSLTIVTDTSFDTSATPAGEMGVPPQVRREDITRDVWNWVVFDASRNLNQIGEQGERPMTVEPLSSPTPARVEDTLRAEFSIEIQHTVTLERVLEATSGFEIDTTMQQPE